MSTSGNLDEVVATGDLFKQARRQLTNWTLRKFLLSGITLTYFDSGGFIKGKIDISECVVRKMSPEECRNQACKFAFGLITVRGVRRCLLCASSEEDREKWISVIELQIREFQDLSRRFMCTNEQVIGTGTVVKKSFLGRESSFRLTITNYPRLLLIESSSSVLKEQVQFSIQTPPTIEAVDRYNFTIRYRTKEFKFRDNGGSDYWIETFRSIPSFPPWVQVHRKPINIGESLVASNLQSAVKAAGAKPKPFLVTAFATPPVSAGNTPRSNPNTSALESLLRGLGRESTMDESSASLAGKVAAALSESQLLDSTEEEKKIDDDEDAISENDTDYEDNAEEKSEQGDAEEAGKPKVNPQEEAYAASIEVLKRALGNIKEVLTQVSHEIETMDAPKAKKLDLVRSLTINVGSLSGNLTGLYKRGLSAPGGIDADLVGDLTDVVDETTDMLKELQASLTERNASATGQSSAAGQEFVAAVSSGLEDISNRVANHMSNY